MTFKDPDTIETRDLNLIQTDLGNGISNTLIVEIIIDRYDPLIEVELYGFTFFTCQVYVFWLVLSRTPSVNRIYLDLFLGV